MAYSDFHLGYKRTALDPGELIRGIKLKKHYDGYFSYGRKTGARNAQAISKVCMAGVGLLREGLVEDVRIGLGAVAPTPIRVGQVERSLGGKQIGDEVITEARRLLNEAIAPINDIRSVAEYRRFVAGNLLEEFLRALAASGETFNPVLARWNALPVMEAEEEILPCCGSSRWALEVTRLRPFTTQGALFEASDRVWLGLGIEDWEEAFRSHPRIGERKAPPTATKQSAAWSGKEQDRVDARDAEILAALARGNQEYEARFGRVFLVCATGKSAAEMLEILHRRLGNDAETELLEAAEQQRQITQLRLRKWLVR